MSPVTGLARLPGRILSSVHMGNFSPVTGLKKSRKGRETWTEALGTSLSAKFKKVNKDGATFNSYIVRSHRSVINARSSREICTEKNEVVGINPVELTCGGKTSGRE